MPYQTIFKRYECKYLLTRPQKEAVLKAMGPYMALDVYGRTVIRNIYFDTDTFRLVRRSMEKPAYKEKLRLRSYRQPEKADPVFVELKKKYQSVVYKRRVVMPYGEAEDTLCQGKPLLLHSQIAEEIEYFRNFYGDLHPVVFLSYEREAFYALDGSDFRVTFDENILSRREDLRLDTDAAGQPLLKEGQTLMEIKTAGGIPLWMTHCLTREHIYHTSYSKYGTAYQKMIFPGEKGGVRYA